MIFNKQANEKLSAVGNECEWRGITSKYHYLLVFQDVVFM
jgi:hypothetical protein